MPAARVSSDPQKGDTVLHHAVRGNHVELVRSLLGMHPPPRLDLRNLAGAAPIHLASEDCGGAVDLALFEALLAARPDVNATNGDGDAPLHVMCREAGSAPFVRALVSRQTELGLEIDKPNLVCSFFQTIFSTRMCNL